MANPSASIFREGDRVIVDGAVTVDNVVALTLKGIALFEGQSLTIDLGKVTEVDSTAISMLLEWLRKMQHNSDSLRIVNMPQNLISLIQLYGVAEMIPLASCQ